MRTRLTYANVMATIAVFIALGGASFAAFKLPKNSVGTKQLRRNAVKGSKVANGSLTGADINASTLGVVPVAAHASTADSSNTANTANTAGSATNANHAQSADTATTAEEASKAKEATKADEATNATHAGEATAATFAANATNAVDLGGFPATSYQRTCESGTVEAHARVYGDKAAFPSTYTTSAEYVDTTYNCTGQAVEVKRLGTGDYRIHFNGLLAVLGVANVDSGSNSGAGINDFATVAGLGNGEFKVETRDGATGNAVDDFFYVFVM